MQKTTYLLSTILFAACTGGGSDGTSEGTSELRGDATFRDATTDHDGNTIDPATPSTSGTISVVVSGSGTLPQVEPRCALDPAGRFEAHYVSEVDFDNGEAFAMAMGEGVVMTPGGCELPSVTALLVTDVRVRAELEATTQNCETYCAASARFEAEAECGTTASSASCRENAEAAAEAACETTCTTRADRIVAETSLAASLFANLDFEALRGALFGDLETTLVFDHMVDGNGNQL